MRKLCYGLTGSVPDEKLGLKQHAHLILREFREVLTAVAWLDADSFLSRTEE